MSTNDRTRLLGAWNLVSYVEVDAMGAVTEPVGARPLGSIIYADDGRMSAQIMNEQWSPDASNVANGYFVAYSGRFTVDEATKVVSHLVEVSAIPSWMATLQQRAMEFNADGTLSLSSLAPVQTIAGTKMARLVWARY